MWEVFTVIYHITLSHLQDEIMESKFVVGLRGERSRFDALS